MTSVLIFSRDSEWYGGVVNFIQLLKKYFSSQINYTQFTIGRRKGKILLFLRPFVPLLDMFRLIIVLSKHRYDAYHINPSLNYSALIRDALFMLIMRIWKSENIIVVFHGWDKSVESTIDRHSFFKKLFIYAFSNAASILVLAEDFRSWLVNIGFDENKIQLFTTMFDSEEFETLVPVKSDTEYRILFLSRLVREKGVYELLDAFNNMTSDNDRIKLIYAGNGPEEAALKKYVNDLGLDDKVEFAGYVRGQEKVRLMKNADIFVFPTYYGEGCPVSLLEAMAAGLPVITTPVGGISDIIMHNNNGIILEDVTPVSIELAIKKFINDDNLSQTISKNNKIAAWEKYSAPVVTKIFEHLYSSNR